MYLTKSLHLSVQQCPDASASIFGDRVRTVREHAKRVARVASGLRELGLREGERVGILSLNSDRYAELLLAVPWVDGVFPSISIRRSAAESASANSAQARADSKPANSASTI